jgi:proto-oncogene tyrosine-protein kinase Ret
MVRPENCSLVIYNLLECCWTDDPIKRPTFKYLATKFENLLGRTAKYLEMEEISISNPMYIGDEMGKLSGKLRDKIN